MKKHDIAQFKTIPYVRAKWLKSIAQFLTNMAKNVPSGATHAYIALYQGVSSPHPTGVKPSKEPYFLQDHLPPLPFSYVIFIITYLEQVDR